MTEQKEITDIFLILLRIRTRLLEKDPEPAYEGNNSRPIGMSLVLEIYDDETLAKPMAALPALLIFIDSFIDKVCDPFLPQGTPPHPNS